MEANKLIKILERLFTPVPGAYEYRAYTGFELFC